RVPRPVVGQNREEVIEAFRDRKPLDENEIAGEIKPVFDNLGKAFLDADENRLQGLLDAERMAEGEFALNVLPELRRLDRAQLVQGLRIGIARSVKQNAALMGFTSTEIRNIKKLPGNEAVILCRHKNPLGFNSKMRWWVSKRGGSWKVYD